MKYAAKIYAADGELMSVSYSQTYLNAQKAGAFKLQRYATNRCVPKFQNRTPRLVIETVTQLLTAAHS